MKNTTGLLALCAAAAPAACGGGGDTTSPATAFPIQKAIANAPTTGLQSMLDVTGAASSGGTTVPISGTLTTTLGVAAGTTFNIRATAP